MLFNAKNDFNENYAVVASTVHGFQGDECDIIINLMNSSYKVTHRHFINNHNILNVGISRAKQYLINIIPDKDTVGYEQLNNLNKINDLIYDTKKFKEYNTEEIESLIFNQKDFIEKNTYVTTHNKVNLYDKAEHYYEVRCTEESIDIHITRNSI